MWQLRNMTSWRLPRPLPGRHLGAAQTSFQLQAPLEQGHAAPAFGTRQRHLAYKPKLSSDLIYYNSSIYHIILLLILSISGGVIFILGICIIPCLATTQLTATPCQQTEGSTDDSTCFAHTCFAHAMLTAVLLANQCLCRAQSIAQMGELSWQ